VADINVDSVFIKQNSLCEYMIESTRGCMIVCTPLVYACIYLCLYVCMYVCMNVCMHVCMTVYRS